MKKALVWKATSPQFTDEILQVEDLGLFEPTDELWWIDCPDECVADPNAGWRTDGKVVILPPEPPLEEQRIEVYYALKAEHLRALTEQGVTFTNAAGTTARYRLNRDDQQNITGTAVNGDPAFTGVTKTSLNMGEVDLTAADCHALAVKARQRVIQLVEWYKAQKAAIEASNDPLGLLPFTAPPQA